MRLAEVFPRQGDILAAMLFPEIDRTEYMVDGEIRNTLLTLPMGMCAPVKGTIYPALAGIIGPVLC